uniref:Uncharacterized protein n=1 Tax=viral metagenome TaxID=1070528 RepID=A0A6M3KGB5_9ZZZZ
MAILKDFPPECPEVRRKRAGDESYDICDINGKSCLIEHGLYECAIYDEYLKELKDEGS